MLRGGLKLRKLNIKINDWIHVPSEFVSGDDAVEMTCTCLGGFLLGGSNAKKWSDHRKNNFLKNNSVGLSMYDGPIETVKYIWVNI